MLTWNLIPILRCHILHILAERLFKCPVTEHLFRDNISYWFTNIRDLEAHQLLLSASNFLSKCNFKLDAETANVSVHEYCMPIILFMNANLADLFNESSYRIYLYLFLNEVTLDFCIRTATLDPNIVRKGKEVISYYSLPQESINCEFNSGYELNIYFTANRNVFISCVVRRPLGWTSQR